ncbi:DUF87 domain-containing protein [Helicobacter saguini]|uniref:ATP-binding protein n=1 Tax=Helicobacter saguini TaxID=1548018 RepID=UPI00136D5262|nr:ATP-binding protein [Helicobacter saguini]MWV71437.1 DUF87 domain-containing protein [Helicobacter saguini]
MNEQKKIIQNDITNIRLDITMQGFLQRQGLENMPLTSLQRQDIENVEFIKISHIGYDRQSEINDILLQDISTLLSSVANAGKSFIYMIENTSDGLSLYLGIESNADSKDSNVAFLQNLFNGIYAGGKSEIIDKKTFKNLEYTKMMLGLPSLKKDSNKVYKQGLEWLISPLQNTPFRIFVVAKSYSIESIQNIISNYQNLGNEIHKLVKQSKNLQESKGASTSWGESSGTTDSKSTSVGSNQSNSYTRGESTSHTLGISGGIGKCVKIANVNASYSRSTSTNTSTSTTTGTSYTDTTSTATSHTTNIQESINTNTTYGITIEEINKSAEFCEKLIDKYIQRFQHGLNDGMWQVSVYLQADSKSLLDNVSYVLKSVCSGQESFYESIRFTPSYKSSEFFKQNTIKYQLLESSENNVIDKSLSGISSALNTQELAILNALPTIDINGICVSKYSHFGLSQGLLESKNVESNMQIGNILNRKLKTNKRFYLSNAAINSHIFVSGITGSGKSNSIKKILLESSVPFLVIEPVKSEYKNLISKIPHLQVFRPGVINDCFRFNPFIFSGKNLTKHVDMLKTTFCSAFPMYGPMSYILEDALHRIYEDKGWNFNSESNPYFTESKSADKTRKMLLFPTMLDLKAKIDSIVEEAGYAGELDSNIKAALKTRINNLTLGIKGKIFNSHHALDSNILFEKPSIIELSNIADDAEKAFLMGLILDRLYVYREAKGDSNNELKHICVIEEAHRLLPNISLNVSSEEANPRGRAVESFVNLLAEIRSYGQGLIIADQIASKLHPDVIKNTNVKILHRTMDKEDRDLIGNAINLTPEQILDIAELKSGEAIVHNKDVHTAFMVSIDYINVEKASVGDFSAFNTRFIESNEYLKYELPFESRFYIANFDFGVFREIPLDILKRRCFDFIASTLLDSNFKSAWGNFCSLLEMINIESSLNIRFYLFSYAFLSLSFISNMQYYKNVDCYLEIYKAFLYFINALNKNEYEAISKAKDNLQVSFAPANIKNIFMKEKRDGNIDFTLLLLESLCFEDSIKESESVQDVDNKLSQYLQISPTHKNFKDLKQTFFDITKTTFYKEKE